MADNRIEGRHALVTGASGGIGEGIARSLAAAGVHLALSYSANLEAAEQLKSELLQKTPGLQITIHQADLSASDSCKGLAEEAMRQHGGRIDILVSSAGDGTRVKQIWDIDEDLFDKTIAVNLKASYLLAKALAPGMRDQNWGRIVFISSVSAYGPGYNGVHYAASKGGLIAMAKNLADRLAPFNISVNDVAPGPTGGTAMVDVASLPPSMLDAIPLRRLAQTDEVARVVKMLCETGFVTGQSIVVAGGIR